MSFSIEQINIVLNDLWNFHLTLFGIALSIFTLLYSFILSKRDELRSIAEQIKEGGKNPLIIQKESYAKKYINRLKKMNDHILALILSTFSLSIVGWISERLVPDMWLEFKKNSLYIITFLTILIFFYTVLMFAKIYKHYITETKV